MVLIFGITGATRKDELLKMEIDDIKERGDRIYLVNIPKNKTDTPRSFTICDNYYDIVKKYINLRPAGNLTRFFVCYRNGKCIRQPIGEHKFPHFPRQIAEFLNLDDPGSYTGKSISQFNLKDISFHNILSFFLLHSTFS